MIETWIPDLKAGLPSVFSFETGGFPEQPKEIGEALASHSGLDGTTLQWLRENPGDAILASDDALQFFDGLVYYPTINGHPASWEELTPDRVVRLVDGVEDDEERRNSVEFITSFRATLHPPAAMVFTTREKRIGVLQILGSRDDPRRVDFRYKLIQGATAREAPVAGQNRTLSFGPMIEKILGLGDSGGPTRWLDLDAGRVVEQPPGWWVTSQTTTNRNRLPGLGVWLDGTNLTATAIGLVFLQTVSPVWWDAATPADLPEEIDRLGSQHLTGSHSPLGDVIMIVSATNDLPQTFVYKTPKRTSGLLQIIGFAENPRSVKIRYKLVRGEDQSALTPMASVRDWLALMDTGAPGPALPSNCRY